MSFLKIFSGKTAEDLEQKGDEFAGFELWGKGKLMYERALDKLEKASPPNLELKTRLHEKIRQTKEALAHNHKQNAEEMIEGGYHEEARPAVELALELTENFELKRELERMLKEMEYHQGRKIEADLPSFNEEEEETVEPVFNEEGEEYFKSLCDTLPEEVQKAYLGYDENFRAGYLALNRGDFKIAADYLSRALEENLSSDSYIPLELATAYLNLEKPHKAQSLLKSFLQSHPDALPAYQLLCEIFWESKRFEEAEALLSSIPEDLTESVAVKILRGETLFHAGSYSEVKAFFRDFLKTYGWNEPVARILAKTHEALAEQTDARNLYREIMEHCSSCHAPVDPFIKQKYADLGIESGLYNTEILELYLSLVQDIPDNAAHYYEKISRIYAVLGNEKEERRFRSFATRARGENPEKAAK
ncbi:MAG TPA: tetratricopeptide repeat protein [Desulfobacterales bacterium]|nr:tetratricopeptide repeat protein [Desulfobacterales bacterium]